MWIPRLGLRCEAASVVLRAGMSGLGFGRLLQGWGRGCVFAERSWGEVGGFGGDVWWTGFWCMRSCTRGCRSCWGGGARFGGMLGRALSVVMVVFGMGLGMESEMDINSKLSLDSRRKSTEALGKAMVGRGGLAVGAGVMMVMMMSRPANLFSSVFSSSS